jgi:type II secretory pathway pseudopilin PulG
MSTALSYFELLRLPVTVGLATFVAMVYLVRRYRRGDWNFSPADGLHVVVLMVLVTTSVSPAMLAASSWSRESAVGETLQQIRAQIDLYKLQHGGTSPLLFEGSLPQLLEPTDADGTPGPRDGRHPLGPYFLGRFPANPATGRSVVTPTDVFPPVSSSGQRGWLYHQASGRIAADLQELLDK